MFRVMRVVFGVPESYGNSPGSIWALLGHTGIEERGQKEGGLPPPLWSELDKGRNPPFLLPLPLFPLLLLQQGRWNPTRIRES